MTLFKVIFKNNIGKILYESNISGAASKHKRVEAKAYKNQLKIAVCRQNAETKKMQVQHCLINFLRSDDLEDFVK